MADNPTESDTDQQFRQLEDQSVAVAESIVEATNALRSIDTLEEAPREESIEEARIILRWLRNMEFADRDLEEFLDQGTPPVILSKKQNLQKLVQIFSQHLRHKQAKNREALQAHTAIQNARDAMDAIALEVAENTRQLLAADSAQETKLDALIDSLPETAKMRQNQSLEQLLDTIELGLAHVVGKTVELSPFERLTAMGAQLEMTAAALQSPDSMHEPAREESIELAHEIIRRLHNMSFSDRSLEEFMQTGKPEDKAAFAQQVGEVAELYKNLLIEAAQSSPEILQEESIQKATNTVETFLHSVKLMAAKEMPTSIASTQHISASASQEPEEWGDMHKKTIDRLLKTAEEALEKAIEEVALQQENQEKQQEQAQEADEQAAALQHTEQAKRKKKRRKGDSKPRSGKGGGGGGGGKKSRNKLQHQQDRTADEYVNKLGRFAEHAKEARVNAEHPTIPGIKASDMELIKQLGGSLREFSGQAAAIVNVSSNDKIVPDDKTVGQRILDREQQQAQGSPKGQGGPRA